MSVALIRPAADVVALLITTFPVDPFTEVTGGVYEVVRNVKSPLGIHVPD